VTTNRTCVLLTSEDMITQRIDAHLAGAKRATVIKRWNFWITALDGCNSRIGAVLNKSRKA